jgi:DNA polymerase III sliding clamp (beta) subunit (PCNA family)
MRILIHDVAAFVDSLNVVKKFVDTKLTPVGFFYEPKDKAIYFTVGFPESDRVYFHCRHAVLEDESGPNIMFDLGHVEAPLKKLKGNHILIETVSNHKNGGDRIQFESGKMKFDVLASDHIELQFPDRKKFYWSILDKQINEAIYRAFDFASKDITRNTFNGIFLNNKKDNGLRVEATDGHRLYVNTLKDEFLPKNCKGLFIPETSKTCLEAILKKKPNRQKDLFIGLADDMAMIGLGDYYIVTISELRDGNCYPSFDQVANPNEEGLVSANVPCSELKEAIDQVSTFVGKTNGITFKINEGSMNLDATDGSRAGSYTIDRLDADVANVKFIINYKYVNDALDTLGKDTIINIKAKDSLAPTYWMNVQDEEEYIVIMPMRM